jgi:hypothetical protein
MKTKAICAIAAVIAFGGIGSAWAAESAPGDPPTETMGSVPPRTDDQSGPDASNNPTARVPKDDPDYKVGREGYGRGTSGQGMGDDNGDDNDD